MANMRRCEKGLHIYDTQRHTLCPHCSSAVFVFDDKELRNKELKDQELTQPTQPTQPTKNNANNQVTRKLRTNSHQKETPSEGLTRIISSSKTDENNTVTKKLPLSNKLAADLSEKENKNTEEAQQCSNNSKHANAEVVLRPVVAWLVIIEGPREGSYTPIFTGTNLFGFSKYEGSAQQHALTLCLDFSASVDDDNGADIDNGVDIGVEKKAHLKINYDKKSQRYSLQGEGVGSINLNSVSVKEVKALSAYDRIGIGKTVIMFIPFCGENFQWPDD